jgi:hypothetical protein
VIFFILGEGSIRLIVVILAVILLTFLAQPSTVISVCSHICEQRMTDSRFSCHLLGYLIRLNLARRGLRVVCLDIQCLIIYGLMMVFSVGPHSTSLHHIYPLE